MAIIGFMYMGALAANEMDNDPHAKGYRIPTEQEKQWFIDNSTSIESVGLTDLAITRINEYRIEKGLGTLPTGLNKVSLAQTALPDNVDNSKLSYFPPVSSQGNLNCCAAFSTTYYQFSYMANFANKTAANSDNNRFSTKWTFDFVNGGGNNGTNFTDTYMILKKNGCASLKDMPYDTNCTQWSTSAAVWRAALNNRIDQIGSLGLLRTDTELANLKRFLVNGYIIAFSTSIGNWQYIKIKDDPATAADDAWVGKNVVAWTKGGCDHAMTIVGYNDNIWTDINGNGKVDSGEKGALRIVNNWGTGYEDGGFCWIAYDALIKQSKVAGYTNALKDNLIIETAWCTVKPNYAPKLIGQFTLRHAKRNQIAVRIGYSDLSRTTPAATWDNEALNEKGGALSFNGTTSAVDGTFCLDFTGLVDSFALANGTTYRWYCIVKDSVNDGSALTIKDFSVIDTKANKTVASSNSFPTTADGTTVTWYADLALSAPTRLEHSAGAEAESPIGISCLGNKIRLTGNGTAATVSLKTVAGRKIFERNVLPSRAGFDCILPQTVLEGIYVCTVVPASGKSLSKTLVLTK